MSRYSRACLPNYPMVDPACGKSVEVRCPPIHDCATVTSRSLDSRRPLVVVLMATYNGARWIDEQVATIVGQHDVDVRIMVCDDGSVDDTLERLEFMRSAGAPIAMHRTRTRGGSAGQNFIRLIAEASLEDCDFVALADQDDIWDRHKLKNATDALRSTSGDGYSAAVRATWPNGAVRTLRQSDRMTRADYLFEGAGQGCTFVFAGSSFIRLQRAINAHRQLTADIHYHDWLLYALARAHSMAWYFDPQTSMAYRQHAKNDTGARGTWSAARKRLRLIREGWYTAQVAAIANLCIATAPNLCAAETLHAVLGARGVAGRLRQASFVLRNGRRRFRDNLVLVTAAALGWLSNPASTGTTRRPFVEQKQEISMNRTQIANYVLARLDPLRAELTSRWRESGAIANIVVDDVLPAEVANEIRAAYPRGSTMRLKKSLRELKYTGAQMDQYNPILEEAVFAFQDERLVRFVSEITGLQDLEADELLYVGGISMMSKGHFLNPHIDNSHDKDRERYRVLNLLYYVSPGWNLEKGGNLEIWPDGLQHQPVTIESRFNRLAIMITHTKSWHSVTPVVADEDRCCVSNYYFSRQPAESREYFHVTSFRGRPEQKVRDLVLRADIALRTGIRKIFPKGMVQNKHFYDKK